MVRGRMRPPEFHHRCSRCQADTPDTGVVYACAACGAETLDTIVDLSGADRDVIAASRDRSLWRYAPLLPVPMPDDDCGPLRTLGMTPLHHSSNRADALLLKDDGLMPTGSLKDRASAIVVQRARALGVTTIITASTGNAGVAIAAMARRAQLRCIVVVPASAPAAKIAQLSVFGAELYLINGTYDDAFALAREAAHSYGWYCRNTALNPFTIEGKKTVSFEICEQLGWRAPARIFVSVGDGNIISGVHKGFKELHELGWIDAVPPIVGVQAEGSAAIANALRAAPTRSAKCQRARSPTASPPTCCRRAARAGCGPRHRRTLCHGERRGDHRSDRQAGA